MFVKTCNERSTWRGTTRVVGSVEELEGDDTSSDVPEVDSGGVRVVGTEIEVDDMIENGEVGEEGESGEQN